MLLLQFLLGALLNEELELLVGVMVLVLAVWNEDLLHLSSAFLEGLAIVAQDRDVELVVVELDETGSAFPAAGVFFLDGGAQLVLP